MQTLEAVLACQPIPGQLLLSKHNHSPTCWLAGRQAPSPLPPPHPHSPHTLMVRSAAQVATALGSPGPQSRPTTLPACPVSDSRSRPLLTSHTRTACSRRGQRGHARGAGHMS